MNQAGSKVWRPLEVFRQSFLCIVMYDISSVFCLANGKDSDPGNGMHDAASNRRACALPAVFRATRGLLHAFNVRCYQ